MTPTPLPYGSDLFGVPQNDGSDRFRLVRLQTFNWGTFSGVFDFVIPARGYLLVGPSGSGKSTLLDANAALMTPPKWVDFNVAAREAERGGRDRSLLTYLRGAWSQQTGEGGETAHQYLRPDTTWSALAETFRDGQGRVVVLAQVLWVRGRSVAPTDVKRQYLVLERAFDVRELAFLPAHDFDVRRFKFDLPDAFVRDEFSAYQERFRRLLGIDSERALRLLHKTQSAKNLGDLNVFLRDFMLDEPETFALADRLVERFQELDEAHRAVVDARRQIETLAPARDDARDFDAAVLEKNALDELSAGLDAYKECTRKRLLDAVIGEMRLRLDGMAQEAMRLDGAAETERLTLRTLQDRRHDLGGGLLERLAGQLKDAEEQRDHRIARREVARAACLTLGWAEPDGAVRFTERRGEAGRLLQEAPGHTAARDERRFGARTALAEATKAFGQARDEIEALERQRSNLPAKMLALRETLARALGIAAEQLPFAGELIEVRPQEAAWQGAIERVLGGFARALLVDDRHYARVSAHLNDTFLAERLVYFRVLPQVAGQRTVGSRSLVRKLDVAASPHAEWVREELKIHFDFECADSVAALRASPRAITKEGLVKHNATRHEKNDRTRVGDRSQWVLGFDNAAKLALFRDRAADLGADVAKRQQALAQLEAEAAAEQDRLLAARQLADISWDDVDVAASLDRIAALQAQVREEQGARPDLARLDREIAAQQDRHRRAQQACTDHAVAMRTEQRQLDGLDKRLAALRPELLSVALTPWQQQGLDDRFARHAAELSHDTLDAATTQVLRALNADERELAGRIDRRRHAVEQRFADFVRLWPAEAGGLDATLASAPDFFARLERLETDDLPRHEARFLTLLREQSDQNLTRLATQLDHERKAIRERMALVNESLATAPFNPGTHLTIETHDRLLDEVVAFRRSLRASLSHSFGTDAAEAEKRFGILSALVRRFASQDTADRRWRDLVLDVRRHVEFAARELDADGTEIEVYRSGAGKSGGQRQKLAATCLAAALRYQLGGHDRALPRFSTVFLDEAFDKADAEFTAMAMNIFCTFGFQMIVATPLKSVMTLEPFIGGACFVHIRDRKVSQVVPIDYDDAVGRLKLTPEAGLAEEAAAS